MCMLTLIKVPNKIVFQYFVYVYMLVHSVKDLGDILPTVSKQNSTSSGMNIQVISYIVYAWIINHPAAFLIVVLRNNVSV